MYKTLISLAAVLVMSTSLCLARELPTDKPVEKPSTEVQQPLFLQHEHTSKCILTSVEPVQIICILDRSGSMRKVAEDTIGGYNTFIEKQKQKKGRAEVTTVLFDDRYEKIVDAKDIQKVPELTNKNYYPRGMTALLDAVGRTITGTMDKMNQNGICPAKRRVLFLIMTDGKENNSLEYTKADVKAMIDTASKEYKWNFIFMGANIDSVSEAAALGIGADHAVNYKHDAGGVRQSFSRMDAAASEMRDKGSVGESWKQVGEQPQ